MRLSRFVRQQDPDVSSITEREIGSKVFGSAHSLLCGFVDQIELAIMKRSFTVYLDSSALIRACDGADEALCAAIDFSLADDKLIYPFSSEQIDELTSSGNTRQNASRLEYISRISKNIYFCNSITELGFFDQTPQEVFETINEAVLAPDVQHELNDLVTHKQRLHARSALGVCPNVLNNMNGKEAAAAIEKALSKLEPLEHSMPRSLKEIFEFSSHFVPPIPTGFAGPSKSTLLFERRNQELLMLFSLLDTFGYWPDSEREIRRGSGFTDARHVVNASFYHVLVSADKGLRRRAEAAYQILGLNTHVLSVEEFVRLEVLDAS